MKKYFIFIILAVATILIFHKQAYALDCSTTLRVGSRGYKVKELQSTLNKKINCGLDVDGDFGNLTKTCVKKYQKQNNLEVDGIVGPMTCKSLNSSSSSVITTYKPSNYTKGIVTGDVVNIRSRATTSSSRITYTTRGSELTIVATKGNWYKIKIPNSNSYGYIYADYVAKNCVVVDISEQKLYFYSDGQKSWSTKVITGLLGVHDTPIGSYTMYSSNFEPKTTLNGYNDNGTKYSSYVNYWMPFITSRGIGFHDADEWRDPIEYTSTRYKTNGSHGCVNMQLEAAKKLYYSVNDSIKVVVRN